MRNRRNLGQPSDIAFLLIIFFLLLSGIDSSSGIAISLGQSGTEETTEKTHLLLILSQDGTISRDDEQVDEQSVTKLLSSAAHVTIEVERATPWQHVVSLLSIIEQQSTASFSLELTDETST